jgi:hypothetical protein
MLPPEPSSTTTCLTASPPPPAFLRHHSSTLPMIRTVSPTRTSLCSYTFPMATGAPRVADERRVASLRLMASRSRAEEKYGEGFERDVEDMLDFGLIIGGRHRGSLIVTGKTCSPSPSSTAAMSKRHYTITKKHTSDGHSGLLVIHSSYPTHDLYISAGKAVQKKDVSYVSS